MSQGAKKIMLVVILGIFWGHLGPYLDLSRLTIFIVGCAMGWSVYDIVDWVSPAPQQKE